MVLAVEFDTISLLETNQSSAARCRLHEDERCTLTRAAHRAAGSTAPAQRGGRPLGLLAAWLSVASMFPDKESHRDPKILRELSGREGLDTREAARVALRGVAGSETLFAKEKPAGPSEGDEPGVVP